MVPTQRHTYMYCCGGGGTLFDIESEGGYKLELIAIHL